MAETIWNDVMYNDLLQSDGFVVDYAVCTTYSLDMPTLLSVPFMLGGVCKMSDEAMKTPHLVLDTINHAADKFAVYCNAGNISCPDNVNSKIYSLLEKSVVQINLGEGSKGFVNFHPKVWIIKETNPDTGESQVKVAVMSRNLSMSNDLDIVCALTAPIDRQREQPNEKNKPLQDFLLWLRERTPQKAIRKGIDLLCEAIDKIDRFELNDGSNDKRFCDYAFYPMGIPGHNGYEECWKNDMLKYAAEAVIISPFIDLTTLKEITWQSSHAKKTLITRHSSLTQDIINLFTDGVYVPKEVLTDTEEKDVAVDIHEKVYFIRHYDTCYNTLYLGSTNATVNGFNRNVEFLLKLVYKPHQTSYHIFRDELIYDAKDCLFEKVETIRAPPKQDERAADELAMRGAIASIEKATVSERADLNFDVKISYKGMPTNAFIRPLYCPGAKKLEDGVTFSALTIEMLTEFYVIEVGDIKRVVKIQTKNIPTQERDLAIFQSIVNSKSKFVNYIAFMLSDSKEEFLAESEQIIKELLEAEKGPVNQEITPSLYEDMLKMAYKNPSRFKEIRELLKKVNKDVIPEGFEQMISQFEAAIKEYRKL